MMPTSDVVHGERRMTIADYHLASDRRLALGGMVFLAAVSTWFVRTDFVLYPANWQALSARLAVRLTALGILVVGFVAVRSARNRPDYSRWLFGAALAVVLPYVAVCALRPPGSGLPMRAPVFTIAVMYAVFPNTFWRQILPPLLFTLGLVAIEVAWLGAPGMDLAGDVTVFLALNAVGILAVYRRQKLEREVHAALNSEEVARVAAEQALAELRILRGIIPICGYCKCVRTEDGDWQQIEQYVRDHSDAEFSHGVCPDCLRRRFPELEAGPVG